MQQQALMIGHPGGGDAVMNLGREESLLTLLKHCREMKQQETRLRCTTLLLLVSCVALFLYTNWAHSRQHHNSQGSMDVQSPAYSKQERVSPTDNQKTDQRLRIHLSGSQPGVNESDTQHLKWEVMIGQLKYNQEKRAIVIPEKGVYFVYVSITLSCADDDQVYKHFTVKLHKWNKKYNLQRNEYQAEDIIPCGRGGSRTLSVGQLCDLKKGDHLSVWVSGYELIQSGTERGPQFGAFLP